MTISKEKRSYDNIKKLASGWARNNQESVIIYKQMDGGYNFIPADSQEAQEVEIVELVSHLQ